MPVTLKAFHKNQWLSDGAFCVMEAEKEFRDALPDCFEILDERLYGDTKIILAEYAAIDQAEQ